MSEKILLQKRTDGKYDYRVQYLENAGPHLRAAEVAREKESTLRANKKNEYKQVASVPWTVAMKIKDQYGVDPLNLRTPEETRKYLQVLQRDYPKFLTTNKKVYRPIKNPERDSYAHIPKGCLT